MRESNIDKIPFTVVPHRSFGRMTCLPHEDVGIVDGKFKLGEITAKNEELYRLQMQKNKIDVDSNGVNQMKYEIVSEESIYNRHKMINVRF